MNVFLQCINSAYIHIGKPRFLTDFFGYVKYIFLLKGLTYFIFNIELKKTHQKAQS